MPNKEKVTLTLDHIEADLVLNYDETAIISPEKKAEHFINAAETVIQMYGRFVNKDILEAVFPGLDINSTEKYNFQNSRARLFILDDATYDEIRHGLFKNNSPNEVGSYVKGQDYDQD
ncbi:MAG: hypothetical protein US97_C0032G0006, partial [Microgenomates group bacterium GW2011_GWF1_38_5]